MALATGSTIRLGIDCRLSGSAHAGIGRYTENLIRCLLGIFGFNQELPHSWELTCFFYSQEQALQVLGENGLIHPQLKVVITPIKHYTLAEQFQLPTHYSQAKLDLLHVPHFNIPLLYSGAIHITIHDLLWHSQHGLEVTTLPNWIYWLKYAGYKFITQQAVTKASRVFVPSEFVKQDVIKHYPKSSEKIVITPEGINQSYLKMRDQLLANQVHNLPTPKPIIYYTGSLYPHKNIEVVLKALTDLPQISLVIAGSRSVFVERTKKMISQLGLTKQVTFAGYVDDAQLISDYQSSLALVQPSLSEGFGLTGIEAMAAGLPIIASDIPVFHEIYQSAAIFAQPHKPAVFAAAIQTLLAESSAARTRRILLGLKQTQQYSWQKMTQTTVEQYINSLA